MIEIKELMEEDIPKYTNAFLVARDIMGDFFGEYFKIFVGGQERLLHYVEEENGNIYTIYVVNEDDSVSYDMFATDKEQNVRQVGYDDFELILDEGMTTIKYRDEVHAESLCVRKRTCPDYDGLDGSIIYAQYNGEKDERAILVYNQMHFENNKMVYENRVRTPFSVQFEAKVLASQAKGKSPKNVSYISRTFDSEAEPMLFGVATVKDYGMNKVLGGGYSLQRGDTTTKYFKILYVSKSGNAITGFPICKQYTQEDMEKMLESKGFQPKVPKRIMNLHNGNDSQLMRCREVASLMKDLRKNLVDVDCKKLELELGLGSGLYDENN